MSGQLGKKIGVSGADRVYPEGRLNVDYDVAYINSNAGKVSASGSIPTPPPQSQSRFWPTGQVDSKGAPILMPLRILSNLGSFYAIKYVRNGIEYYTVSGNPPRVSLYTGPVPSMDAVVADSKTKTGFWPTGLRDSNGAPILISLEVLKKLGTFYAIKYIPNGIQYYTVFSGNPLGVRLYTGTIPKGGSSRRSRKSKSRKSKSRKGKSRKGKSRKAKNRTRKH